MRVRGGVRGEEGTVLQMEAAWDLSAAACQNSRPASQGTPPSPLTNHHHNDRFTAQQPAARPHAGRILTELVERHGWEGLALRIPVRCFEFEPSIKSSLKFLRSTLGAKRWRASTCATSSVVVAELAPPAGPRVAVVGRTRPA